MKNYLLDYWNKINSGEIVTSRRVKQQYKKLVQLIEEESDDSKYIFDLEKANKPITFIEKFCRVPATNKPMKLDLWQKAMLQAIFGFVHRETELRKHTYAFTLIARKNGKTGLNACIALYMLIGDGEGSAECYIVSNKLDQSRKLFDEAYKMVAQSPLLSKHIKKRRTDLYFEKTFSKMQPLASNSNSLDGLNSHLVIAEENHSWKDRNLLDVMIQSTSFRSQPLVNVITTNGFVRDNVFDQEYDYICEVLDDKTIDETVVAFLYELDSIDEWQDEVCWVKANPALNSIKKLETLRNYVNKAKSQPSFLPTVLVKDFNLKQNSSNAWLSWDVLNNETTFNIKDMGFKYGILGFDKSETTDLMAATLLLMRPDDNTIYSYSMYWLPSMTIEERAKEDSVPYHIYERQGLLRASGDYKNDMNDVIKWIQEIKEELGIYILWCGYDPWHVDDSTLSNFESELGKNAMIKVRQGAVTLSEPMKNFEGDLKAKLINYNNNNLTKMCFANTQIKIDTNGNIAPVKGRDTRKRIDGMISHLCAYTILLDKKNEYLNMI